MSAIKKGFGIYTNMTRPQLQTHAKNKKLKDRNWVDSNGRNITGVSSTQTLREALHRLHNEEMKEDKRQRQRIEIRKKKNKEKKKANDEQTPNDEQKSMDEQTPNDEQTPESKISNPSTVEIMPSRRRRFKKKSQEQKDEESTLKRLQKIQKIFMQLRSELAKIMGYIRNRKKQIKEILEANVNYPSPLILACIVNDIDTTKELLELGADVNANVIDENNIHGHTPIMIAAAKGYEELVKLLLAKGADPRKKEIFDNEKDAFAVAKSQTMKNLLGSNSLAASKEDDMSNYLKYNSKIKF